MRTGPRSLGYNARNDEIRDNVTRMRREWEAQRFALATVRRFNAIMSSKGKAWFWPTIGAAQFQNIIGLLSIVTRAARLSTWICALSRATRKHQFGLHCVRFNARVAMGTAGHALSPWREPRLFEFPPRPEISERNDASARAVIIQSHGRSFRACD